ncbi:MAG: 30S ribosomal protein S6 [Candidatus Poribacteria bacterium]|nr:30S ribosomal protein S6 [Candidatus Poribacteria bacterium]MDE0502557.1 30S ribosomal protein S6 [Candidatus Poribacteria bacterium]
MREYELVLIINPDLEEAETESLIERIKTNIESNGGEVLKVDAWGRRRLAFPIKKNNDGYYVLLIFKGDPAFVLQLSNSFRVIESIVRHMVVLFEGDLDKVISLREESRPRERMARRPLEAEDQSVAPVTESEDENSVSENEGEDQAKEETVPDNS